MKILLTSVVLVASVSAQAQGFFKKATPAESPAVAASQPRPAAQVQAPEKVPAVKPAATQAASPASAAGPTAKPKSISERPRAQQPRVTASRPPAGASAPPQMGQRQDQQPAPAPQPPAVAQPAPAMNGMVDPVGACAGGWGITQAFCRSVQCQKAESFHHPVCADMRAEQAARARNQPIDGSQ